MPRKRMIHPSFWDDLEVAKLTRDERLFVLGCLNNSDDEGRLKAHPAYLKAAIFMYDDDINLDRIQEIKNSTLEKMASWRQNNIWRLVSYENSDNEYLYFPLWYSAQAPSHPQPSQLPAPSDVASILEVPFTEKDRRTIYERDNWICQYCGANLADNPRNQTIDHVIPLTQGGSHHHSNLVTACKSCNLKKKNRRPEEAGMPLLPTHKVNQEDNLKVNQEVNQPLSQIRLGKVSIGKVNTLKGFSALKEQLNKSKNKTGFLVEVFKEVHSRAPPGDFENLGGRIAGILKTISNDHLYLLGLIWDTSSVEIKGSHLNYIQGKIRGKKRTKRAGMVSSEKEIEESLK